MPENFLEKNSEKGEEKLKVLNLYAGIGGNRKLWDEVTDINVTAVEIEGEIAEIYQDFFPEDEVVIGDAHKFLKENYKDYDFIWSSPPCPTHSQVTKMAVKSDNKACGNAVRKARYPDMDLYQEIILLEHFFDGFYCIENVNSYYEPLIKPQRVARHYLWANFFISDFEIGCSMIKNYTLEKLQERHGFDISDYKFENNRKDQVLRNCVHPQLGKHVLECAYFKKVEKLEAFL